MTAEKFTRRNKLIADHLEEIVRRTVAEHRAALLRAALQEDQRREDIPF